MNLKDNIIRLTNAFGVTGAVCAVDLIARDLLSPYMDTVEIDSFGNVIGRKSCGVANAPTLLLDAHIDQPGFLITQIEENGFLRFMEMGIDRWPMPGSEMRIQTRNGEILPGVIAALPSRLQSDPLAITDLMVDTGMTGAQANACFHIGDYMVHAGDTFALQEQLLCGSAMDNRAGFAGILYALELLQGKTLPVDLIVTGSSSKDGGRDIAWREQPAYAICVDVCHAKTCDSGSEIEVCMGRGPVIQIGASSLPHMAHKMMQCARAAQIPHQLLAVGGDSSSSAWKIKTVGNGVSTLVVSLPVKYIHAPAEVLHLSDVEQLGRLLAEFLVSFEGGL